METLFFFYLHVRSVILRNTVMETQLVSLMGPASRPSSSVGFGKKTFENRCRRRRHDTTATKRASGRACEKAFSKTPRRRRNLRRPCLGGLPRVEQDVLIQPPPSPRPPSTHFLKLAHLTLVILLRRAQLPRVYTEARPREWLLEIKSRCASQCCCNDPLN